MFCGRAVVCSSWYFCSFGLKLWGLLLNLEYELDLLGSSERCEAQRKSSATFLPFLQISQCGRVQSYHPIVGDYVFDASRSRDYSIPHCLGSWSQSTSSQCKISPSFCNGHPPEHFPFDFRLRHRNSPKTNTFHSSYKLEAWSRVS